MKKEHFKSWNLLTSIKLVYQQVQKSILTESRRSFQRRKKQFSYFQFVFLAPLQLSLASADSHGRGCSSSSGTDLSASCAGDAFPGAPASRARPGPSLKYGPARIRRSIIKHQKPKQVQKSKSCSDKSRCLKWIIETTSQRLNVIKFKDVERKSG